jgi:ATP-dependent RNA helicase DDX41
MLTGALQEEWRMPLEDGEGPLGLVVCPSRELARQTYGIVQSHIAALHAEGWPELRCLLCVGGEDMKAAGDMLRRGIHMAICTPGRLKDFLSKRRMNLDICRYLCLDEADRMVCDL